MAKTERELHGADAGIWCYGYLESAVDAFLERMADQELSPLAGTALEYLRWARQRASDAWDSRLPSKDLLP